MSTSPDEPASAPAKPKPPPGPFARLAEVLAGADTRTSSAPEGPRPTVLSAPPAPRVWSIADLERFADTRNIPERGIRPQARARPRLLRAVCVTCDGVGDVFTTDARGYSTAHPCDCKRLERFAAAFDRMELPPEYALISAKTGTDWDSAGVKGMRPVVERFIRQWHRGAPGLVLCGPNGVGKGHLAALICTSILARTRTESPAPTVRMVEWTSLIDRVKNGFGQGVAEESVLSAYVEADLLWLDELGKGQRTEWSDSVAERLVCRRMDALKTTIVTTNLPPYAAMVEDYSGSDLGDCIGERARSRLMGRCAPHMMTGDDWRLRG